MVLCRLPSHVTCSTDIANAVDLAALTGPRRDIAHLMDVGVAPKLPLKSGINDLHQPDQKYVENICEIAESCPRERRADITRCRKFECLLLRETQGAEHGTSSSVGIAYSDTGL